MTTPPPGRLAGTARERARKLRERGVIRRMVIETFF